MASSPDQILELIRASGSVTDADIFAVRQIVYPDGVASADEVDLVFKIEAAAKTFVPAWSDFFREVLVDFTVFQTTPRGYVSQENAYWLIAAITADAHTRTATELEALIGIITEARWVPECLTAFVLRELKTSIVEGTTPLADGSTATKGAVDPGEVELIRRVLFAAGGAGHIGVSQAEAELLFDINDATDHDRNAPAWSELFVKAILNHVMAYSGYTAPPRDEALRLENWSKQTDVNVGGFLGRMVEGGIAGIMEAYRQPSAEDRAIARLEEQHRRILLDEEVTPFEADWVARRINRDGKISPNETQLIKLLTDSGAPSINPWLDAARAAS